LHGDRIAVVKFISSSVKRKRRSLEIVRPLRVRVGIALDFHFAGHERRSRRGNGFTARFPEIARACENLQPDTLIDGEVVAIGLTVGCRSTPCSMPAQMLTFSFMHSTF
jgi:hypothetical protein